MACEVTRNGSPAAACSSPADSATGGSWANRASLVSRRIHRLLRVPPSGSSASVFTKDIASCDFFLAGLRPLVLTRPSGPGAGTGNSVAPYVPCGIREGLPMSREPALLTSAGRMPKRRRSGQRSQHRVSEGQRAPIRRRRIGRRSERPATGHGQPRTVADAIVETVARCLSDGFRNREVVWCRFSPMSE